MPRPRHLTRNALVILVAGFLLALGLNGFRVVHQARQDETQPADAIIVFGAAEYVGRPSPVFRARLDHAFDLFQRGVAPVVIVTGGSGADPKFTEGGVGRDYLSTRGIPDQKLIAETQGDNTAESVERVFVILQRNGMRSADVVSDAYHMFRIKKMMQRQGVTVFCAPRPGSYPRTPRARILAALREALSYMLWWLHL